MSSGENRKKLFDDFGKGLQCQKLRIVLKSCLALSA